MGVNEYDGESNEDTYASSLTRFSSSNIDTSTLDRMLASARLQAALARGFGLATAASAIALVIGAPEGDVEGQFSRGRLLHMSNGDGFWKLEHLSDRALLDRVEAFVRASRRGVAEVVAHLGEVEERRLHLDAGYGSMFAYCVAKLGMSEDEACRRIDVARLARQFPGLFVMLANGRISLSVAALLKPHLSEAAADALLDAVGGCTVQQAREVLAARSPRPNVASSIRKLPGAPQRSAEASTSARSPAVQPMLPRVEATEARMSAVPVVEVQGIASPPEPPTAQPITPKRTSRAIEPLSAARYKVQFAASTEFRNKLELARDLLRHAVPGGDLGAIVERALDLLIESLMQTRFGQNQRRSKQLVGANTSSARKATPAKTTPAKTTPAKTTPAKTTPAKTTPAKTTPAKTVTPNEPELSTSADTAAPRPISHISRAARRDVLARDGLRCSFRAPDGTQCESRAWLEHDHIHPLGKGGTSHSDNLRLLCRAHNRRAAEHHCGREHIERSTSERNRAQARRSDEQTRSIDDSDATSVGREPS